MPPERRYFAAEGLRFMQADAKSGTRTLQGYAAMFNSMSENLGGFYEVIEPGFFRSAIASPKLDCASLFNHNPDLVLGRTKAGTCRVKEDIRGLMSETDMIDTQCARDLIANVEAGNIYQMSFGFTVRQGGDSWEQRDGKTVRTLKRDGCDQLWDISPVTYAAYQATSVKVRTLLSPDGELDFERVQSVLVKHQRDLELSEDELNEIRNLDTLIKSILDKRQTCDRHTANSIAQLIAQFTR